MFSSVATDFGSWTKIHVYYKDELLEFLQSSWKYLNRTFFGLYFLDLVFADKPMS